MVKDYDVEDCYGVIRSLATGKRRTRHSSNDDPSETAWATNELNRRRKFFQDVETLNAAKQSIGEALAMVELSLLATSACNDDGHSLHRRSSSEKRSRRHRLRRAKLNKEYRIDSDSKDPGYFTFRHKTVRTLEREACRDRVDRARSFQVRRTSTSHDEEEVGRNSRNTEVKDGQGKKSWLRRSSSERLRPLLNAWHRTTNTGTGGSSGASPTPVDKHQHSKDRRTNATQEGWCRYPAEETIITDPETGIKYKKGKLLGKGGFAKCYEFSDAKTKEKFAVKVVSKNRMSNLRTRDKILREIEIHRYLNHSNIVSFYGFFECKGAAFLILEHCVQQSMVHVLTKRKTLTEPEVRYYMLQLVDGCRYIHGQKIIHRDLKLGNMLLDNQMRLKIADFGLATKVLYEGEKKMSLCGTPNYIAPEVLQKKGHSYEADIWALGCVMYTMLIGKPPFETTSLKETYHRIINSRFTIPDRVTQHASQLISKMLSVDPQARPSLVRISGDRFFSSGYTPTTLSTFCCDTAPRFPLSKLNNRNNGSSDDNDAANRLNQDAQNNNHNHTKNSKTKHPVYQTETRADSSEKTKKHERKSKNKNENDFYTEKEAMNGRHRSMTTTTTMATVSDSDHLFSDRRTVRLAPQSERCSSSLRLSSVEDRTSIRLSVDRSHSVKTTDPLDNGAHLFNDQTHLHQTYNDTKVTDAFDADFDPLYRLLKETTRDRQSSTPSTLSSSLSSSSSSSQHSPLWITKWVDYSNKYGFGYQLSDGRVGILFSESGHILLSPDGSSVTYTSRLNKRRTFELQGVPDRLQRKLLVVQDLAGYMKEHLITGGDVAAPAAEAKEADAATVDQDANSTLLLQKWYRDHRVIVMHLNNGTLQINFFQDHSKLVLSPSSNDGYLLTYIFRGRPATTQPLSSVQSDSEVIERMRTALHVIEHQQNTSKERGKTKVSSPGGSDQVSLDRLDNDAHQLRTLETRSDNNQRQHLQENVYHQRRDTSSTHTRPSGE